MFENKKDFFRLCKAINDHAYQGSTETDVMELAYWTSGFLNDKYLKELSLGRYFSKMWDFHQELMELYKLFHCYNKSLGDMMLFAARDGIKEPKYYIAHLKPLTGEQINFIEKRLFAQLNEVADEIHQLTWV